MLCKRCSSPMKHILRFVDGKSLELEQCPKCYLESKPVPIKFDKNQRKETENKKKVEVKKTPTTKKRKKKK